MAIFKKISTPVLLKVVLVLFGVIGLTVAQSGRADAAKPTVPLVGIVDYSYIIDNHPDTQKANQTLQAERDQARKEYVEKSAVLNDKGKQDLEHLLNQRVEQKRLELLKPILAEIDAAIKKVADAKGLAVVMYKNNVAYGGLDITEEVLKKVKE